MNDNTIVMPAIALRGMTILPDLIVHFDVSRRKSINALEKAMIGDQRIFLVTQRNPEDDDPELEELYTVGTVAKVKQLMKLPNNIVRVLVEGEKRAILEALDSTEPCLQAEIVICEDEEDTFDRLEEEAMLRNLREILEEYFVENPKLAKENSNSLLAINSLVYLMNQIATGIPLQYEDKQKILEAVNISDRYDTISALLVNEVEVSRIKRKLNEKVKAKVDKNQREYILREELKVIREELGEDTSVSDADNYAAQVKKLKAPKAVKEKLEKEIVRFKNTIGNASENTVIRTYIETLLEMPWNISSKDNKNIKDAERILNEDHYGLDKVKTRILESLAVRNLTDKGQAPIICLVGPPGTGKTSIARSVARALNKKYVRISLGGVRDEAEIRGHRRTYVGAMPGRLANALRTCQVNNPVMLLDEIDKVSNDYKGDTFSALLEVLDPEQNVKFRDHYIELPVDLSEVLFICTANTTQTIPRPLLDRMEIIEVTSYTENEKYHIASRFLIPKQIERNGLREDQLSFSKKGLQRLIRFYTREAGVRNLERKIGDVCRKTAREILEDNKKSVKITESNISNYLGKEIYSFDMANEKDEVGIVRGLAWTSVGGDTLQIEVNVMPGKGDIQLTGQLGDVMKESARTGISFIRSALYREYNVPEDFFEKHDIHIHIPEGAVPKDGPSAGISMATAIISAITDIPVRADVAMTGEITLRGRVLPIGGLKEKTLAAKMAGIKTVLVPKKNERDIQEISAEIKKGLEIIFVESMHEVLDHALVK